MINLLPLTLILWPFSIGVFNSQIVGVFISLVVIFIKNYSNNINFFKFPFFSALWYFLLLIILIISIFFQDENSEITKFLYYIILIPFLFYFASIYEGFLNKDNNFTDIVKVFYTAVPFVIFCVIELIFPSFREFVGPYFSTEAARHVIESGFSGNSFRNLGWTGFLFADYSVALSFTALGILIFKKTPTLFSLFFEFSCVFLALIAGRSSLPIIFIYIIISFVYRFNLLRIFSQFAIVFFSVIYIFNKYGSYFFIWMLEPFYRYLEEGDFSSGSVNETKVQFEDFFNSINNLDDYNFLGDGVYFSSNFSYAGLNIVAGDSGFIRIYHAVGLIGLLCFLFMWFSILLRVFYSLLKNKEYLVEAKLFLIFFMLYGFVFFFKSEWLYQKFFIFISFYFYHRIYRTFRINNFA